MTDALTVATTGDRGIVIAQTFAAGAAALFEAWTTPDFLRVWLLGPPGWTMTVCDVDLRVGGGYRFKWRDQSGNELGLSGSYREIAAPMRMVSTERFDPPYDQGEALATLTFDERDGRTTVTNTVVYPTQEARDRMVSSNMERGVKASYDRLLEMLAGG